MSRRAFTQLVKSITRRRKNSSIAQFETVSVHHHRTKIQDDVTILGAAWSGGQKKPGAEKGPNELRKAGLISNLVDLGYSVSDKGDLVFEQLSDDPPAHNVPHPRTCGRAFQKIAKNVYHAVKSNNLCLTLGGDHSIAIGTIAGHARANPDVCIIWVDAHADLNPPQASESGNIHGMPLAFLVKELSRAKMMPEMPGLEWVKPCINAKNLAYIGLRDIDLPEKYLIQKLGIPCYTIHEIDTYGLDQCLRQALERINPGLEKPIHLSFDIDALDPTFAPSTGTPVPGGLTMREGMYLMEEVANTGQLSAIDLVEVNPDLGQGRDREVTVETAIQLLTSCFGKRSDLQILPKDFKMPMPEQAKMM